MNNDEKKVEEMIKFINEEEKNFKQSQNNKNRKQEMVNKILKKLTEVVENED